MSSMRNFYSLPQHCFWGTDWVLVDPWAIAMGWEDILYTKESLQLYPYTSMLSPLTLIMRTVDYVEPNLLAELPGI